jgi:outer membrane protein assembly factor BamA
LRNQIQIFITLALISFCVQISAQEYDLVVNTDSKVSNNIFESYRNFNGDSIEILQNLNFLINDLQENGYLSASIDSIRFDSLHVYTDLYIGTQYHWSDLDLSDLEIKLRNELGLKISRNGTVNLIEINKIKSKILSYYENSGYPFVEVRLDDLDISNDLFNAKLIVEKGDFYTVDSIIIKGDPRISSKYIKRTLQLDNDGAFNQKKINDISKKINDLKFLKEIKPAEIEFKDQGLDLYLYLEDKKANMFNGIIGFLPKNEKTGELLITGELNLNLINSFGRGEELSLNWEKLESSTQKLDVGFIYPYLFGSNFGLDTEFELFKKDSSYLSLSAGIGFRFFLSYDDYIKAYYRYKSSSKIGDEDVSTTINFADIKSNILGVHYYLSELDYSFNPRKGIEINLFAGVGLKNTDNFQNSSDSATITKDINSTEVEAGLDLNIYFPIYKNFIFHFENRTRYLNQFVESDKEAVFYENELYRFGGAKSLRGFDESVFYASIYSIQNVELRYLFEQNSAFYIFWNGAYYYKNVLQDVTEDFPWGFGIGLDFETGAGIFSLSYALGKQFDNPFEIQSAKIHFGYVNRF